MNDELNTGSGNTAVGNWQPLADSDLPPTLSPENQDAEALGVQITLNVRES